MVALMVEGVDEGQMTATKYVNIRGKSDV